MTVKTKIGIFLFVAAFFLTPLSSNVIFAEGDESFFIESAYDLRGESTSDAKLLATTEQVYFYIDKEWWEDLSEEEKEEKKKAVDTLGDEFKENIYPHIKENFGDISRNDVVGRGDRISVLFHPMTPGAGGYFRSGDQYSRYQYSRSNERNILYLNADSLKRDVLPGHLAHEYIHLVTFNEKNREFGVNEEIWLNELRAEMIISILGYDEDYEKSNLSRRVNSFLRDPDISLTEWTEQAADYGVVNTFGQYLLDHYGEAVLEDSLRSKLVGIPSIDYALEKNGFEKSFAEIFTDWTVAVYLNDCSLGEYYCYKNEDLGKLTVSPATVFLASRNEGPLTVDYQTKNWAGNWYRIVGGSGNLYLEFQSEERFVVPYVLCEKSGDCKVKFIDIDKKGKGEVVIEEFNSRYESIVIIPSLQEKVSGFNGTERGIYFQWKAEVRDGEREKEIREKELQELRERLAVIRKEVERLYAFVGKEKLKPYSFEKDLYYGMENSKDVKELQRFLASRGKDIYPEGIITGNFYYLTKQAVTRFQEHHREEILDPLGLTRGTGYVGSFTRKFVNSLIKE